MVFRFTPIAALLLALVAAVAGCAKKQTGPRGGDAAPVVVAKVERKVVPLVLTGIGAVEPIRTVSVRAQVTGTLVKIHFQEGDEVHEGDLLFELDARPFQNGLRSAEADLERARVQARNAEAQVARYSELTAGSMISKDQLESIRDNARALRAAVLAAEAAVANARLQLDYCSIRAPVSGRTGSVGAHEGDLVRASDTGTPLVIINQLNPIYVSFTVPQQNLSSIMRYRAQGTIHVTATPTGSTATQVQGELAFVDNAIDASTGTLRLKAVFANDEHALWPGQFASVRVTLASPEAVTVPASAVQRGQSGAFTFVVKPDLTAEQRAVDVERTLDGRAVITRGLQPGETVVTDGQLRVVPGRKVSIKPASAETNASQSDTLSDESNS